MEKITKRFRASILLIDDHAINRDVVCQMLQLMGCDVTIAENGRVGLDLLESHRYDLLLVDLQMPEMSGYETAEHIRNLEIRKQRPHAPMLAISANIFSDNDRERCVEFGMNDCVAKPVTSAMLAQVLERYLPPQAILRGTP
jgi:CheY-like chemotaxis protein